MLFADRRNHEMAISNVGYSCSPFLCLVGEVLCSVTKYKLEERRIFVRLHLISTMSIKINFTNALMTSFLYYQKAVIENTIFLDEQ